MLNALIDRWLELSVRRVEVQREMQRLRADRRRVSNALAKIGALRQDPSNWARERPLAAEDSETPEVDVLARVAP